MDTYNQVIETRKNQNRNEGEKAEEHLSRIDKDQHLSSHEQQGEN